jgi:hypothetical protein
VAGLILFAPTARGVRAPDYPWQWSDDQWNDYLDEVQEQWGTRKFAVDNLPYFSPSLARDEEQVDWFERFVRGTASANVELAIENVFRQMDVRDLLPTINVPTLVMHRIEDKIEHVGGSRFIRDAIRGAKYVELDGGDHFLITFDGPARGVNCAREICASAQPLGIEIRAGLHTREIELDGDDVSCIAVAIGARVGSLAAPGEVLGSSTVKDLVVGSGLVFEDRGQHVLKGVPDEWRLYAAVGEI